MDDYSLYSAMAGVSAITSATQVAAVIGLLTYRNYLSRKIEESASSKRGDIVRDLRKDLPKSVRLVAAAAIGTIAISAAAMTGWLYAVITIGPPLEKWFLWCPVAAVVATDATWAVMGAAIAIDVNRFGKRLDVIKRQM